MKSPDYIKKIISNGDSGFMANGGDRKRYIVADGITKMGEEEH